MSECLISGRATGSSKRTGDSWVMITLLGGGQGWGWVLRVREGENSEGVVISAMEFCKKGMDRAREVRGAETEEAWLARLGGGRSVRVVEFTPESRSGGVASSMEVSLSNWRGLPFDGCAHLMESELAGMGRELFGPELINVNMGMTAGEEGSLMEKAVRFFAAKDEAREIARSAGAVVAKTRAGTL